MATKRGKRAWNERCITVTAAVLASELRSTEEAAAHDEASSEALKKVRRFSVLFELRANAEMSLLAHELLSDENRTKGLRTKMMAKDFTIRTQKSQVEKLHVSIAESTAKIESLVRQADQERQVARAKVEALAARADKAELEIALALEQLGQALKVSSAREAALEEKIGVLTAAALHEQAEANKARAEAARAWTDAAKAKAKANLARVAAEGRAEATRRQNTALKQSLADANERVRCSLSLTARVLGKIYVPVYDPMLGPDAALHRAAARDEDRTAGAAAHAADRAAARPATAAAASRRSLAVARDQPRSAGSSRFSAEPSCVPDRGSEGGGGEGGAGDGDGEGRGGEGGSDVGGGEGGGGDGGGEGGGGEGEGASEGAQGEEGGPEAMESMWLRDLAEILMNETEVPPCSAPLLDPSPPALPSRPPLSTPPHPTSTSPLSPSSPAPPPPLPPRCATSSSASMKHFVASASLRTSSGSPSSPTGSPGATSASSVSGCASSRPRMTSPPPRGAPRSSRCGCGRWRRRWHATYAAQRWRRRRR